jgi:predicted transcriptional regulator
VNSIERHLSSATDNFKVSKVVNMFNNGKRRDKLYIIAEILKIAKEGTLKTQIMYRANLSFTQMNDYLKFMLKIDFLSKILENDKETYKATAKGMVFLQRYGEITELLMSENDVNLGSMDAYRKGLPNGRIRRIHRY